MAKFDGKLMRSSLQALCKPDEKYYYPVYGNVGKVSKTFLGQNCIKFVMDNQGKDYKVQFTFANNVYGMGIPDQKENLAGLIKKMENHEELLKATESYQKLQKIQAWIAAQPNMQATGVVSLEKMAELRAQQATQSQPVTEKPAPKKVHKEPDYIAMLNREKEYTISLCERLETKYGKAEFGAPVTEREMVQWETANQVTIPEDYKEISSACEKKMEYIRDRMYLPTCVAQ